MGQCDYLGVEQFLRFFHLCVTIPHKEQYNILI